MADTAERVFLGRSPAGGRVGIYMEERPREQRFYVGRDAGVPCAIRRWWADTSLTFDIVMFNDLRRPTVSTSVAIACAVNGGVFANNRPVGRRNFHLHINGCAYYTLDPTVGVYDRLAGEVLPWPNTSWAHICRSAHFEFTPDVLKGN